MADKFEFYDIESLSNVFTLANFKKTENHIDLYILCDNPELMATPAGITFCEIALDRIYEKNHNFNGTLAVHDLSNKESFFHLAKTFGLSDAKLANDPNSKSQFPSEFRPVCDTDPDYDPSIHPYFVGYNSANYDTTMLAAFYNEYTEFIPVCKTEEEYRANPTQLYKLTYPGTTANRMRQINDELFENFRENMPKYLASVRNEHTGGYSMNYKNPQWRMRRAMMMTGRQIDASALNEKQKKVALKRQLGLSGFQILESDRLGATNNTITDQDMLLDLIAYNASDIINLDEQFQLKLYVGQFTLKRQLLKTYPELVYKRKETGEYAPDCRPECVRDDRLFIDSTSSQLAQKTLCPYDHLKDAKAVSFMYPSPNQAAKMGIKPVNVLEEARKFFYEKFPQPEIRAKFDSIYHYYKSIEGKNFNESDNYKEDWGAEALPVSKIEEIPKPENCIVYYDKNGQPTSCYATFSVGGVHGAEYNLELFMDDMDNWMQAKADMEYVKSQYPNPADLKQASLKIKSFDLPNGETVTVGRMAKAIETIQSMTNTEKTVLMTNPKPLKKHQLAQYLLVNNLDLNHYQTLINKKPGITMPDGTIRPANDFLKSERTKGVFEYKDIDSSKPALFKVSDNGSWKLNPRYVFTSADKANHEDFTSYYPNLLRRMEAFYNPGLGYDRYAEIFDQKQEYGGYMKDKKRPASEREYYSVLREGTKLILNSASGAGDATFDNNIRMNNNIISMRIIGQLFSWRIGQAQAYEGAKVTSTNTDGLYSVMEEEINNAILERESASIGVEIEPEPLYLISKDTNNRLELTSDIQTITAASGGTLACRKGPNPTKSLAHPAIIDWALAEYLTICAQHYKNLDFDQPFNNTIGMNILKSAIHKHNPVEWMRLFQNVIASSTGSVRYIFGTTEENRNKPVILQHYNRVFYMKNGTKGTLHLHAAVARVIPDKIKQKRREVGENPRLVDPKAAFVLRENGVANIPTGKDIVIVKVSNIEPEWCTYVENRALKDIPVDEFRWLVDNMDYDCYLQLLRDCYESNWRNNLPNRRYVRFFDLSGNHLYTQTLRKGEHVTLPENINEAYVIKEAATEGVQYVTNGFQPLENTDIFLQYA